MMKSLKKFVRRKLNILLSYREYLRDARRFRMASTGFAAPKRHEQWRALLTIDYHRIEKGLALPDPRAGFGTNVIDRLLINTPRYIERFGQDDLTDIVANCLRSYAAHNAAMHVETPNVESFVAKYDADSTRPVTGFGGTAPMSKADVLARSSIDPEAFFNSRSSVRQFSEELVSDAVLTRAVQLAVKTPSVCNRQSGRAYCTTDPAVIAQALSFQNGNRGFGHTAPALFAVCSEFDIFEKLDERNQGWIDGGLFAMTLVYALHSLGLGSCMLNWSVPTARDANFRAAFGIPENQGVICMIAVGHLPDTFSVAQSPRRPVDDFKHPLIPQKTVIGGA